ncbi:MAG TPA: ATP-dependent RNA helicase HrpA [Gammaproteobacteria bacterium]|nr:ATP-dependent RNA helicase HrpA [Gammaproteobacteria bacterium]
MAHALRVDRYRLRQRWQALKRRPEPQALAALAKAAAASRARRERRAAALPAPTFPAELPVSQKREAIARAITDHQVVIICGETGSGKTTQLPKICLELGRGVTGYIGHTQPRRIAARAVATRIAEELGTPLGQQAGYKVRFGDHVQRDAYIKVMTDGILLAEIQGDRFLDQYDTLIIDEAHERSLNIDFLLGYLKRLLPKRPDLKLIITSATIDPARFAGHFGGAPVIEVSGRTYPVDVRYRPLSAGDEDSRDRDLKSAILDAVDELAREGPGDMLVFLPGERAIRETAEALRKHHPPHTEIVPLFARLAAAEQNKVFQPHGGRRIVLATNVAETSLTVPGIRFVVDTGLARISRYSHRAKVQRLPIEAISQASARQRAGRCGRVGPGVCIRLYSEEDFLSRPGFTAPEILRSHLAAVILQMEALHIGAVDRFPFVDPPDPRLIRDGYQTLAELGAVDPRHRMTGLGRRLARLPVDPRIGRMILAADQERALREVLIIAAALAVQDPRERPLDRQQAADEAHARYRDPRSDFLGYLKLWEQYHHQARHLSNNKLRQYCREQFLSYVRLRDWHDTHGQLLSLTRELGLEPNEQPADYAAVHRALLAGLLGQVGLRREGREYLGARGVKFHLFPGSGLCQKPPQWIMAAEVVETSRRYARIAARIDPAWLEPLAAHLLKRHYSGPYWSKKAGAVLARERVTLYGLPVVTGRKVPYGPIDPKLARELFIRGALVAGEWDSRAPFFQHNRAVLEDVQELEHKARRHDILVDEETLFQFYDERVPAGIFDVRTFEAWRKTEEKNRPRRLFLTKAYLMRRDATELTAEAFPEHVQVQGLTLPLSYHFEPGTTADGVTVTVPLALLNQLRAEPFQWLVPGLLQEKIAALIKTLPKHLRRNFVPAPNFAQACIEALVPGDEALVDAVGRHLRKITGMEIPPQAWQADRLPDHLHMNFRIIDEQGTTVAQGRDLRQLQQREGGRAAATFARLPTWELERDSVTDWDFGDLPEQVTLAHQELRVMGYPALVAENKTVALRLLDQREKAAATHRLGLRQLFKRKLAPQIKCLAKNLPDLQQMCLAYAPLGSCATLKDDLINATLDRVCLHGETVREQADFEQRLAQAQAALVPAANELGAVVQKTLQTYQALNKRLKGAASPAWLKALSDIRGQLDHLIYPGFVAQTPPQWLIHLPRYLQAVSRRLDKLDANPLRDRQLTAEISPLWQQCLQRMEKQRREQRLDPELNTYRWWLEEYRVSLFAQELKTALPVSAQRLKKQWEKTST